MIYRIVGVCIIFLTKNSGLYFKDVIKPKMKKRILKFYFKILFLAPPRFIGQYEPNVSS